MRKTKKAVKAAPKKVQRGGKKSNEFVAKVLADFEALMPPAKICKKYNISARTLLRYQNRKKDESFIGKGERTAKQTEPEKSPVVDLKGWMEEQLDSAYSKMNLDVEKQYKGYRPEKNFSLSKCPTCNNMVHTVYCKDGTNYYSPTVQNHLQFRNSPHTCPNCGSKLMGSLADTNLGVHLGYNYYKIPEKTITFPKAEPKFDPVNKPAHYADSKIEVIDYIEDKKMNYNLGNAVKYISRAGKKTPDPLQDLEKGLWYLQREITNLKKLKTTI